MAVTPTITPETLSNVSILCNQDDNINNKSSNIKGNDFSIGYSNHFYEITYVNPDLQIEERISSIPTIKSKINIEDAHIVFIGDSRFVAMKELNKNDNYDFYCKVGKGYNWYQEEFGNIQKLIDKDTIIIFELGINDLWNLDDYKTLKNDINFSQMYFLSVNPVNEQLCKENGYDISNKTIENFNNEMKLIFGERYIDTNSYLQNNGFNTTDGLHYTKTTYQLIYDEILNNLNNKYK